MNALNRPIYTRELTTKCLIPPLLGYSTCMDTLPGVLRDSLAEEVVLLFRIEAHVTLTGFDEVVDVNVILAATERRVGENLFTKSLCETHMTHEGEVLKRPCEVKYKLDISAVYACVPIVCHYVALQ